MLVAAQPRPGAMPDNLANPTPETSLPWHAREGSDAVAALKSHAVHGLAASDIATLHRQYGPNVLPIARGQSWWWCLLLQFHQPLIYILIAAALVTLCLKEWVDSAVIFGVVLVNAIIGFLQENRAARALDALNRTMITEATVIRSGERHRLPASELVPGDLVVLQSGDRVPADLRLVRTRDLQINEAALTGESLAVEKHTGRLDEELTLADRRNMAYSSALVTFGHGVGVVVATGSATEIGHISNLIAHAQTLVTPLTKKIAQFSHLLLYLILILAAATFAVGVYRGSAPLEMFMAAVALAVGAIPEGLPAAVTITLAIGVSRMARRHAIVRKLPAVETLGSTTVICSDKTGTLTQNEMTVQAIYAGDVLYRVSGTGYTPEGKFGADTDAPPPQANAALQRTLLAGVLCNDARLIEHEGRWSIQGDPTEGALLTAAAKADLHQDEASELRPRLDAIPFESDYQYMATLHRDGESSKRHLLFIKGALEAILPRCKHQLRPDGDLEIIDTHAIHQRAAALASQGLRVLALAEKQLPTTQRAVKHDDIDGELTFVGLQGMLDPPRDEAIQAVAKCQLAGVRVKMITGDHALTAQAIARQIGIASGGSTDVYNGEQLAKLPDDQLADVAERCAVFARVTPEQKLRLVKALQGRGHIVAMTGDGVNDAPALKQANIGVAMGITGTEVAKEAADMVLADDNFASIEAAVEEGRGVFDNLTKFIVWTLPTNLGEGLVILTAVFFNATLPILPVQILWINMTTAVLLGLMLAFEPQEQGIMSRPPRDPKTPLLTGSLIERVLLVGALLLAGSYGLFQWALGQGMSPEQARTVAVNVFVCGELAYLFNCRSLTNSFWSVGLFSNRWLWCGVTLMIALQLAFTYVPLMNTMFESAPIGWLAWAYIWLASLGVLLVVGIEKLIRRRLFARDAAASNS